MIEISTTSSATTLTIGAAVGRQRLSRIHIGSGCWPAPTVRLLTMTSQNAGATAPTLIEVQKALRGPELFNVSANQWVVNPGGGHWKILLLLKALTAITTSGM